MSSRKPVSKSLDNSGPMSVGFLDSSEYLFEVVARCLDFLANRGAKRRFAPVLLDKDAQG
jgi:hypothetical protein